MGNQKHLEERFFGKGVSVCNGKNTEMTYLASRNGLFRKEVTPLLLGRQNAEGGRDEGTIKRGGGEEGVAVLAHMSQFSEACRRKRLSTSNKKEKNGRQGREEESTAILGGALVLNHWSQKGDHRDKKSKAYQRQQKRCFTSSNYAAGHI